MSLRILLNGSKGRMGQAIIAAAPEQHAVIAAALDMGDDAAKHIAGVDAVIDFSHHTATPALARLCNEHRKPLVIGTTGHNAEERAAILAAIRDIPVVWAGNYSVGVNVLNYLVRLATEKLDEAYDIELVEMHHHHKKDAPSGTAEKLLEILKHGRGYGDDALRHGRSGITGARPKREIGVHALRGGDVIGDHTVIFAGDGERVELTHKASNRAIFATGSVRAAQWAATAKPGLYGMEDVLGLR